MLINRSRGMDDGGRRRLVPTWIGTATWPSVSTAGNDFDAGRHTCGVRTDGTLWCWGSNVTRRLGDAPRVVG
jgi:alpha-tubulin suppressor-like RCC1 family protein